MVELQTLTIPKQFFEDEIRNGFNVNQKRKQVWAIELDLYAKLKSVCEKHNLSFFADAGTLLGAIRHNGFIPWDDDMDFVMFREDYDYLCKIAGSEFRYPYFFQSDEEVRRGHIQIRNSETTAIIGYDKERGYKHNQGIFIDIFPIDGLPSASERRAYWKELIDLNEKASNKLKAGEKEEGNKYYREFDILLKKYPPKNSIKAALLSYELNGKKGNRFVDDYKKVINYPFEFINMVVPNGYERILRTIYGTWKKPIIMESDHKDVFFDVSNSYTNYLKNI